MEKFITYEKLSKKKKKELNAKRRKTWGAVNPVTRRPQNPKAYNRKKTRRRDLEDFNGVFFLFCYCTESALFAIRFPCSKQIRIQHFTGC